MSLTRDEWLLLFDDIIHLEGIVKELQKDAQTVQHISGPSVNRRAKRMLIETSKMKKVVQSVIGQME